MCFTVTSPRLVTMEMTGVTPKLHGFVPARKVVNIGPSLVPPCPPRSRPMLRGKRCYPLQPKDQRFVENSAWFVGGPVAYANERPGDAEGSTHRFDLN